MPLFLNWKYEILMWDYYSRPLRCLQDISSVEKVMHEIVMNESIFKEHSLYLEAISCTIKRQFHQGTASFISEDRKSGISWG